MWFAFTKQKIVVDADITIRSTVVAKSFAKGKKQMDSS